MRHLTISAMLLLLASTPLAARAQGGQLTTGIRPDTVCSYHECALGIAPTWNGLAIVRGTGGPRVANLHFFWPHDVSASLRGNAFAVGADSAAASAHHAVALRRAGAALTDLGVIAGGVAVVSGLRARRLRTQERVVGSVGLAAMLVSVPLQFAADGALSRAVWWHNLRYAH